MATTALAPPPAPPPPAPLSEHLLDAESFQRAVEAGVYEDVEGKVELDDGRVIVAPVDGGRHLNAGHRLILLWAPIIAADPALRARLRLYIPGGLRVLSRVVRAPDAMLAPPETVGHQRWPSAEECLLAIELSDTTLSYDDGKKRSDYAKGGLRELWIVRLAQEDVRVCRRPSADGTWAEEGFVSGETPLVPLAAPELAVPAAALFRD